MPSTTGVDYGGYAPRAKVSALKPHERESFSGCPVIKSQVLDGEETSPEVAGFRVFLGHDMAVTKLNPR